MTRYRHACRECLDPVDRDGAELCNWCSMTPSEREADMTRRWLIFWAVCLVSLLAAFLAPAP